MTWGAVGGAVAGAVVTSYGANKAAKTANQGIEAQIAMQREALAAGQEASKFRPVGFTSPYGTAQYGVDAEGNLTNVGFTLTPEMEQRATTFGSLGTEALRNLSVDPMQAARERTNRIISLLSPQREAMTEQTYASLAAKGLLGQGADVGTGQYVNPALAGLQSTFATQDLGIASDSFDFANQDIVNRLNLATSLFGQQGSVYDIGRSEMEYGRTLADAERARRLEGAGMQADAATSIGNLTGQIASNNSQMTAGMYSQFGDIANKAVAGLLTPRQTQPQVQSVQPSPYSGYADPSLTQRWA